jgi:hypothetical protein
LKNVAEDPQPALIKKKSSRHNQAAATEQQPL